MWGIMLGNLFRPIPFSRYLQTRIVLSVVARLGQGAASTFDNVCIFILVPDCVVGGHGRTLTAPSLTRKTRAQTARMDNRVAITSVSTTACAWL